MNSKERVRIAMNGKMPDHVPLIPQLCPPHAIKASGLPFRETAVDWLRNPRKYDLFEAECALNYGFDGLRVWSGGEPKNIEWAGDQAFEIDSQTNKKTGTVDFMGGCGVLALNEQKRSLTEADIESIEVLKWQDVIQNVTTEPMRKVIETYGRDLFIIAVPTGFTIETMGHVQGVEATLIDMLERPDFIKQWSAKRLEVAVQEAIASAKLGADAFYIGDTYGTFMKPDQFRELVLPFIQQFVKEMRSYDPLIYLHMCGQVTHLLDIIPETGVDCFEPLDIVGGTNLAEAKQKIGDKVALMGGISTVKLSNGTLDEVKEDCRRCIRDGADGGGYILATCDMLPTETSPEKVKAMVEIARTFGKYSQ